MVINGLNSFSQISKNINPLSMYIVVIILTEFQSNLPNKLVFCIKNKDRINFIF